MKIIKSIFVCLGYLIAFLFFQAISALIVLLLMVGNISDFVLLQDEAMYSKFPFILILNGIFCILFVYILSLVKRKNFFESIYVKRLNLKDVVGYISIGVFINILIGLIVALIVPKSMVDSYNNDMDIIFNGSNFIISFLGVGIFTPIAEEIIFRAKILGRLTDVFNVIVSVIIQALLFGILHTNPIQAVYSFIVGIAFGIIAVKTRNISGTMLAHMGVNGSSVIVSYLGQGNIVITGVLYLFFPLYMVYWIFPKIPGKKT